MKKLIPAKFIFALILAFSLIACEKSTDVRITEFISAYRNTFASVAKSNPYISSTSAEKTAPNEITIRFYTVSKDDSEMDNELIKKSLSDVMGIAILQESSSKNLINDGVKFKVKILDESGQKVLYSETYDKNSTPKTNIDINKGNFDFKQVLEVFNKNLPMTDPSTGIKIVKIEAGDNNDIIYNAVVPENMKPIFQLEGANEIMKEELLRSPQIKQILSQSGQFGITKLKYRYKDEKDNLLTEISIAVSDLK